MTRLRLPAAVLALLIAGTARADLRTFDIDPQYQQEVFAALTDVLTPDPQRGLIMEAHGRVELLPSGQILVNADTATLEQVEQVLEALRARAAPAAPRVSLRYWAVLGTPAQSDAEAPVGTRPPGLLNDVLSELRRVHGDLTFSVVGTAGLVTQSGQAGHVGGRILSVEQKAYMQGDTLSADIKLDLERNAAPPIIGNVELGDLAVRTSLKRGEFVVLGENQVLGGGLNGFVFYIVHWAEE
jgi:hypothetical protein